MIYAFQNYKPPQPDKRFKYGDRVLFMPPEAAYSKQCKQARCVGKKGFVARMQSQEYGLVVFQDGPCLLNLRYCEKQ